MDEIEIPLQDEYVKLGQALKAAGVAMSGVDAKYLIQDGNIEVNGAIEFQRGKKLFKGDEVTCEGVVIRIV